MATTTQATPAPLLWLRWGLWALLLMVLSGLVAVWWTTRNAAPRRPSTVDLPVLSQIPDFEFTRSNGESLKRSELDAPWVADFIFTRCAVTCPRMTSKMMALGPKLPVGVRRVSITVDPVNDTPDVLRDYAKGHGADVNDWLFLTGPPGPLRELTQRSFLLGVGELDPDEPGYDDEPITHSTRFVLIDGAGGVRGYYDAFDPDSVAELVRAAETLQ